MRKEGGRRHWAEIGEAGAAWGLRTMAATYRRCGRWPFRVLLGPVLAYFYIVRRVARRASREYLAHAEGPRKRLAAHRRSFQHFWAFGECLLDKMLAWSGGLDLDAVAVHGLEVLAARMNARQGGLLIVAHLGNLEVARVLARRQPGLRLTILIHTAHTPRFNRLLAEHGAANQVGLLQVSEVTAGTAVMLQERVRQGEWVVVAGDRVPLDPCGRVARVPFFGQEAPFPVGPYVLADLLQCPMLLLFCLRLIDGYHLYIEPFADRLDLPRGIREGALCETAARFAARLEYYCRQVPTQWFNFFPFWEPSNIHAHAGASAQRARGIVPRKDGTCGSPHA